MAGRTRVPTPVPWLVRDAVPIAARVGEREPVFRGVPLQPREGGRTFEFFFERLGSRRGDVYAATGVVFAVAGRGADTQDFIHGQTAREFALDDAELVLDRAEPRDDLQCHPAARGGFAHPGECTGGAW